jgi:hypothetical protein
MTTTRRQGARRFFRFGLRSLLGMVTLVALSLGAYRLLVVPHRQEQAFLEAASKAGANVTIQRWWSGQRLAWTSDTQLGLLDRVVAVDFSGHSDFMPDVTDGLVALLDGLPSLQKLDLSRGPVSDTVVQSLRLPDLRQLTLRECRRVEVLHLTRMPRLEELDASLSGVRALRVENAPHLRSVHLSRTYITHQTLAALGKLPALAELAIANTPVIGEGLGFLPATLEELTIDFTVLDEAGVAHLARLPNLKRLVLPRFTRGHERVRAATIRDALAANVTVLSGSTPVTAAGPRSRSE